MKFIGDDSKEAFANIYYESIRSFDNKIISAYYSFRSIFTKLLGSESK